MIQMFLRGTQTFLGVMGSFLGVMQTFLGEKQKFLGESTKIFVYFSPIYFLSSMRDRQVHFRLVGVFCAAVRKT